jgi:ABC-type phosphate/phosphonate transport system substrate-binding protein
MMLANARMYSVTPASRQAWREVFQWVLRRAGFDPSFIDHDPPALLSDLWSRDDLGCVMMCGLPFSLRNPQPTILAAPVPFLPRYGGRAIYCTDLAVRGDALYTTLLDTFGDRAGYTLKDSQSGYFAFRHDLLEHYPDVVEPYSEIVGGLRNARGVIQALIDGRIDVGPLDGYAHDLLRHGDGEFASQVRVIASTTPTPMPPIVATTLLPPVAIQRIHAAFLAVGDEPALADARAALLLDRFVVPDASVYRMQRERAHAVEALAPEWP